MEDEAIFKFQPLKDFLRQEGYNVAEAVPWRPYKGVDVPLEAFRSGRTRFLNNGGIEYTDNDENVHIGFLYKRKYDMTAYPEGPRMHTRKCQILEDFIRNGNILEYRFAETASVKVIDTSANGREIDFKPRHCRYCMKIRLGELSGVRNSEDFERIINESKAYEDYRKQRDEQMNGLTRETDVLGYARDWEQISQRTREEHNYTCEKCGIRIEDPFDRHFIHVHHKNQHKEDNRPSNLQCLCIRCHAEVNDNHRQRFANGANAVLLREFKEKYLL